MSLNRSTTADLTTSPPLLGSVEALAKWGIISAKVKLKNK